MPNEELHDIAVVGGGIAGLSAATWAARHRRRVVLLDAGEPRNRWTEQTHGYLGLDPISPHELLERGRDAFRAYPSADLRQARVTEADTIAGAFVLHVGDGGEETVRARRVILATGVVDVFPAVDGFFDHYGRTIFHCPTCDGYEAKGKAVALFGWSDVVAGFALGLLEWASAVTVVTQGHEFEGGPTAHDRLSRAGVSIVEDDAEAIVADEEGMTGVRLAAGRTVPCDMAFFTIAHRPVTDLAEQLGCGLDDDGYVAVDGHGRTSVDGVWAVGDVTPGLQLVQVAAGQGAAAGVAAALSLTP